MKFRKTLTVFGTVGVATVAALAGVSPAQAATVGRSDACNSTVCGSGTFTWASNTRLSVGSMSVERSCGTGSGGSAIQIQVFEAKNGLQYGPLHGNNLGCGKYQRYPGSGSTSWTSTGGNICWWRVAVAATPNGLPHPVYGNIVYNPNHPSGC